MAAIGRIFIGVDLDAPTRAVAAAQLEWADLPGKPVPPENWHLTLRFLGEIDEVTFERMLAELDQADLGATFDIGFGGLGAFPNARKAAVLWRGVIDRKGRLSELAETVEATCRDVGLPPEDRPFRPHLTLARIRPPRDVRRLVGESHDVVGMAVRHVTVFRSHLGGPHARYETVDRLPLD